MEKPILRYFTALLGIIVLLSFSTFLSGCASVKKYEKKFESSRLADTNHFADQTIALITKADFTLTGIDVLYIRSFINPDEKEEKKALKLEKETNALLQIILGYSIQVVTMAESRMTQEKMVKAYTTYLKKLKGRLEKELGLTLNEYDAFVEKAGKQKDLFKALNQAQPIINALTRHAGLLLRRLDDAVIEVALKIDKKIDQKYAFLISYHEALIVEKNHILDSLKDLYKTYAGDEKAFDQLVQSGAIQSPELIPKGTPTEEDLLKIKDHLLKRTAALDQISKRTKVDWENYRAAHRELNQRLVGRFSKTARARMIFLVWTRAHQKMASGVVKPAEWFDISTLPHTLIQSGTKLIP